jgi:serine/threonine protein kinase
VKPANILIDVGANGAGDHAYLSDFGVAKHRLTASGLTSTGHFVGTIDYVSPEQIEGKELDGRTDVYSLGCVLYESLTGVPPFDRDSNVAMIYAHLLDPPPAITERRLDLPAPIDAVVAKALAKAREERFDTCAALVSELRRALAPAAAATRAAGATPLATQLSQPEAPGAAPVTVIAAPGVQPAGALPQTSAATAPSPPTERSDSERTEAAPTLRRKLGRRPVLIGVVAAALIAAAAAVAGAALIHSSSKKSTPSAVHRTPAKTSKTRGQSNGTVTENAVDQTTMVDVYGGPRRYTANRKKLTPAQNARVRALVRAHRSGAAKRYVHTALRARSQRLAQAQSKQARVARLRAARSGSTQTSNTRQRVNALRQKRTHSTSTLNTQERVNQLRQQRTGSTSPSSSSSTRSRVERLRRQRTGG